MAAKSYVWTDREVRSWAREYLKKRETLFTLEERIGAPHSTIWWSFQKRLESINPDLYEQVMIKLEANKHEKIRRNR